jgi:hypothetical protein
VWLRAYRLTPDFDHLFRVLLKNRDMALQHLGVDFTPAHSLLKLATPPSKAESALRLRHSHIRKFGLDCVHA